LMTKYIRIYADNIDMHEELVRDHILEYLKEWEFTQLQQKKEKGPNHTKTCLTHQMFRNTWIAVYDFINLCQHTTSNMFNKEDDKCYVLYQYWPVAYWRLRETTVNSLALVTTLQICMDPGIWDKVAAQVIGSTGNNISSSRHPLEICWS
jgi:hypothetical protein